MEAKYIQRGAFTERAGLTPLVTICPVCGEPLGEGVTGYSNSGTFGLVHCHKACEPKSLEE